MNKKNSIITFTICWILAVACTPPDPTEELSAEEKDLYVSNYDPSINFAEYRTYKIVDSVNSISNQEEAEKERTALDVAILNTIEIELQKKGFRKAESTQSTDVGITVSKVSNLYTGIGMTYTPSYYDPFYWGYSGYNYYYPSYYQYQVKEGSVVIDMVDLKSTASNQLNIIWNGQFIDGVGRLASEERIINGIKGLFAQSTYLKHND